VTSTAAVSLTTTTTAMQQLGLNREQITRLVRVGLLPVIGTHGRTRLLDPVAVRALAYRPQLPLQNQGRLAALAVHLGPLVLDTRGEQNLRHVAGWDTQAPVPASAWEAWWGTGAAIADAVVGLPLLPSVSGFVVHVREVDGWTGHPSDSGYVRFHTRPCDASTHARYVHTRFRAEAGTVWQRLYV